jgi:hypothetical protein
MVGIRSGSSGTGIRAPHFEGAVCSPVQECCAWGPGRSNAQSLPLVTLTPYGGVQRRYAQTGRSGSLASCKRAIGTTPAPACLRAPPPGRRPGAQDKSRFTSATRWRG